MVDFNNEATVGTPAADVERISILQRRYELIDAYEDYKKKRFSGANAPLSIVRARLISLFFEIQATLKRRLKDSDHYEKILDICMADRVEESDILEVIFRINEELDAISLTRIDNKKVYDAHRVEAENKIKGYG